MRNANAPFFGPLYCRIGPPLAALLIFMTCGGCSIKKFAVNKVGDAIASGGSTYQSDDDIAFVGDALPFSLKLLESLLEVSPEHLGMLQTACQGFATYGYVYVQHDGDVLADLDFRRARSARQRALRFYNRARGYCLRGLEAAYPGTRAGLETSPRETLAPVKEKHVPLLYWNAVALGLAISVAKNDAEMLARIPEVEAMLDRALALDPDWEEGSLYEMNIVLAGARPGQPDEERLRADFQRARELSRGHRASLFVAYAESLALPSQDRQQFISLLDQALAIDPDDHVEVRMANLVAQRRAGWLLNRLDDLFLDTGDQEGEEQP